MSNRANPRDPARVPAIARGQAGVFTRRQARDAGWSDDQIRRRLRTGAWTVLAGRGLVLAGQTPGPSRSHEPGALAWAALLSVPEGVLSHLTAGQLYRFPLTSEPLAHIVSSRHHVPAGIVNHRSLLLPADRTLVGGLAITTPLRTALDCLPWLPAEQGRQLWPWLASRQVLSTTELAAAVRDRFGWPGTPNLLSVLHLARTGATSAAEVKLHQLLRRAGITGWEAGATICDESGRILGIADVAFRQHRLILEVDGYAAHSGRDAFVKDRRRQNALVNAGFRVLRITWADLVERPEELIDEIRTALAR